VAAHLYSLLIGRTEKMWEKARRLLFLKAVSLYRKKQLADRSGLGEHEVPQKEGQGM